MSNQNTVSSFLREEFTTERLVDEFGFIRPETHKDFYIKTFSFEEEKGVSALITVDDETKEVLFIATDRFDNWREIPKDGMEGILSDTEAFFQLYLDMSYIKEDTV